MSALLAAEESLIKGSISAVVTFHRERELVVPTLHSVERMRRHAEAHGLAVELAMTLDNGDRETRDAVLTHPAVRDSDVLHEIHVADLSLSRNHAVAHSDGQFVAILDGDDLFSDNWLTAAVQAVRVHGPATIAHPHLLIAFGQWRAFWYQVDQTSEEFCPEALLSMNYWNACALAPRQVFEKTPYECARVGESGFGFEDWHWNCETIASGNVHRVVPGTFRLERRKQEGSLNEAHQAHAAVLRPSRFFDTL